MKKGLTLTMVFEAESANYGEGSANYASLKKMSRSDGQQYSYISRQAMRYNIIEQMECAEKNVSVDKGTMQFTPESTIDVYPEIDLFGYMKTRSKSKGDAGGADTRSAVVRLSNAISLEPFHGDIDFLTNMGLSKRIDNGINQIAQIETHHSFYEYTITIDLDRIGEDGEISISKAEKVARLCKLLETIQFLYRDIKGRRENLAPVFAIGGLFERKCPYYEDRIKLQENKINVERLQEVFNSCEDTKANTLVGYTTGSFKNDLELTQAMNPQTVTAVFAAIKEEVTNYYA